MLRASLKLKSDGQIDIFQMSSLHKVFLYGELHDKSEEIQIEIEGNYDLKMLVNVLTDILNSR